MKQEKYTAPGATGTLALALQRTRLRAPWLRRSGGLPRHFRSRPRGFQRAHRSRTLHPSSQPCRRAFGGAKTLEKASEQNWTRLQGPLCRNFGSRALLPGSPKQKIMREETKRGTLSPYEHIEWCKDKRVLFLFTCIFSCLIAPCPPPLLFQYIHKSCFLTKCFAASAISVRSSLRRTKKYR